MGTAFDTTKLSVAFFSSRLFDGHKQISRQTNAVRVTIASVREQPTLASLPASGRQALRSLLHSELAAPS